MAPLSNILVLCLASLALAAPVAPATEAASLAARGLEDGSTPTSSAAGPVERRSPDVVEEGTSAPVSASGLLVARTYGLANDKVAIAKDKQAEANLKAGIQHSEQKKGQLVNQLTYEQNKENQKINQLGKVKADERYRENKIGGVGYQQKTYGQQRNAYGY